MWPPLHRVFRQRLKTVLFHRSYPNICVIWTLFSLSDSGPSSIFAYLGHFKKFYDDDDDDDELMDGPNGCATLLVIVTIGLNY